MFYVATSGKLNSLNTFQLETKVDSVKKKVVLEYHHHFRTRPTMVLQDMHFLVYDQKKNRTKNSNLNLYRKDFVLPLVEKYQIVFEYR